MCDKSAKKVIVLKGFYKQNITNETINSVSALGDPTIFNYHFRQDTHKIVFAFGVILLQPKKNDEEKIHCDHLSNVGESLITEFAENVKRIELRFINNANNNVLKEEKSESFRISYEFDQKSYFRFFDLLMIKNLFKENEKGILIKLSEIFFLPDEPIFPGITESEIELNIVFNKPHNFNFKISSYKLPDPGQMTFTFLDCYVANISWNVIYNQKLFFYEANTNTFSNTEGIKIPNIFTSSSSIETIIKIEKYEREITDKKSDRNFDPIKSILVSDGQYQYSAEFDKRRGSFIRRTLYKVILSLPPPIIDMITNYVEHHTVPQYILRPKETTEQEKKVVNKRIDNNFVKINFSEKLKSITITWIRVKYVQIVYKNYVMDAFWGDEDEARNKERCVSVAIDFPGCEYYRQYAPLTKTYISNLF